MERERDFMGLGSKENPVTIKEESTDSPVKDPVPMRSSGMQWSFSNKVSAIPQFLSFKSSMEDKSRKAVHDPIASSSAFMSISTADTFDSNQKAYPGMVQKNMTLDKSAVNHYAMTTYGAQHFDAYSVNRPQDVRIFPISSQQNQTITVSMSSPILQSHFPPPGQNMIANSIVSKPLGGVPVITSASTLPTPSSVIGTTDLRDGPKSTGAPAQLTIFYSGSVCVYDDVTPEKAQAIMYLAGHGGPSGTQNKTVSTPQAQPPVPRPPIGDVYVGNRINTTPPCSGITSPISVTSSSTIDLATVKTVASLAPSIKQIEPLKPVSSVGASSVTLSPAVAVPQARKASLTRFLEKRKERVMNTMPYNVNKKSPKNGSNGVSFSVNSSSSFPLPASN